MSSSHAPRGMDHTSVETYAIGGEVREIVVTSDAGDVGASALRLRECGGREVAQGLPRTSRIAPMEGAKK